MSLHPLCLFEVVSLLAALHLVFKDLMVYIPHQSSLEQAWSLYLFLQDLNAWNNPGHPHPAWVSLKLLAHLDGRQSNSQGREEDPGLRKEKAFKWLFDNHVAWKLIPLRWVEMVKGETG